MKKEWALLDMILKNEHIIFTAAIILSAVANGRHASMMSWQIIAPALVMSLSNVLYHWILLSKTASNRLGFTRGLVKFLVELAPNVSFAVKSLPMFAKSLFCMLCIA